LSHEGAWHPVWVSGDAALKRMEAERPYSDTYGSWRSVASDEGWDL